MRDLFESCDPPGTALASFERAFSSWLDAQREQGVLRRQSSEAAYRDLWSRLVRWCVVQDPPVSLATLTAMDLELFLLSRHGAAAPDAPLSARYAWRLLTLTDRVLRHAAQNGTQQVAPLDGPHPAVRGRPVRPNLAAREVLLHNPQWRFANADLGDALPQFLPADQAKRLVDFLSQARPRPGRARARLAWQVVRNRASVALQLGAGLTPGEVRAMPLSGVLVQGAGLGGRSGLPWKLRVPADGNTPERETPIAGWAAQLLRAWLDVRAELGIGEGPLFPSTRSGKPWGKISQYEAVGEVLHASGIDPDLVPGGSFRLRHTFALRQLRKGHAPEDVAQWLGVVSLKVMGRYRRVLMAPVAGLV